MRILSTDPDEPGIFAIGQVATGVFAFGQMATGVIAIGQLARGVVAVGQLAVGFVAIGQACYSVVWGGGMVGLTGRGFGFVLKTLPKYRPDRGAPEGWARLGTLMDVREKGIGTVRARVCGRALLGEDGLPLDVQVNADIANQLSTIGDSKAVVQLVRDDIQDVDRGTYREAPQVQRVLNVMSVTPWKLWPWPFEAITGTGCSPLWQLLIRAFFLLAMIVGWHFIVGQTIIDMFR